MEPVEKFRPGQRRLSAADLNTILSYLRDLANLEVEGGELSRDGSFALVVRQPPAGFWAKLTDVGIGTHAGKYGWVEQRQAGDGTFSDLAGGRTGTVSPTRRDWAREVNGFSAALGQIVWMVPGTPGPSPESPGEVDHHYRFAYEALTLPGPSTGADVQVVTDVTDVNPDDCSVGITKKILHGYVTLGGGSYPVVFSLADPP